jgi:RHS repeat-associated protein
VAYRWDEEGRLVEKRVRDGQQEAVWIHAWNGAGLLAAVTTPEGTLVEFEYDPFARRVRKTVSRPEGPHGTRVLLSETRFIGDGDVLVHEITRRADTSTDELRTYGFEDDGFEPFAHRDGPSEAAAWIHYVNDPIGTPEWLLASDGRIACELRRETWGKTEARGGAHAGTPLRFQGQYEDRETGLCYSRFRYYDPEAGRFISADPIGLAGGLNGFRYGVSPIAWVDPFGLAFWAATRVPGGVQRSRRLTQREAIARLTNADPARRDILADTESQARSLAKAANRSCQPSRDQPHAAAGPGALPHYHPANDHENLGHVFFPRRSP